LDNNAENIFFKNVSTNGKDRANKPDKSKGKNKLSEYLKKGRFDYSLESKSNSSSIKEEKPKNEAEHKKQKLKNFILKSELFSPSDEQKINSEKVSPKTSVLK
jgi:hypothetical protein